MSKTAFKQTIRIGDNVTDIMNLPCVVACIKQDDKNGFVWLEYRIRCGASGRAQYAEKGDWLCEDNDGRWHILTDEDHEKLMKSHHREFSANVK